MEKIKLHKYYLQKQLNWVIYLLMKPQTKDL